LSTRRNRPVLYELVSRSQRSRSWTTSTGESPKPAPEKPKPQAPPPPAARPPTRNQSPGSVRVVNGRVHLTLGWPQFTVLGAVLLVALVVAFQAGVSSVQPGTPTEDTPLFPVDDEAAPAEPDAEPLRPAVADDRPTRQVAVPEQRSTPAEPAAPTAAAAAPDVAENYDFRPDHAYVIVQHLPKSRRGLEAAKEIQAFLVANGLKSIVRVGNSKRDYEVVLTEPFATKSSNAAVERRERDRATRLMERVRSLGKEYASKGYSFSGTYLRQY
jgi:hypothetical protein